MKQSTEKILNDTMLRYPCLELHRGAIAAAFTLIKNAYDNGNKLVCCGNGGSQADCAHIVGELMKSFRRPREIPSCVKATLSESELGMNLVNRLEGALPAVSLGEYTSIGSAFSNDVGFEFAFAQELLGIGKKGDVLLALSTSGNALNCQYAVTLSRALGIQTIALTGNNGGKLKSLCDVSICVPEQETYRVQELHLPVYHALCAMLENEFFGE